MGDTKKSRVEKARRERQRQEERLVEEELERRDEPHPDTFSTDDDLELFE